jgi:glycosyltransferase involved in cell wall biosynthesis
MVEMRIIQDQKNIVIVTSEPFPKGMAATNRILTYAKGLTEANQNVNVLSFKPSITGKYPVKGIFNQVQYQIVSNLKSKVKYKSLGPLFFFIGIKNTMKALVKQKMKQNFIILVSNKPMLIFTFFIICKMFGYKYLQEKSEFPFVINKKSFTGKLYCKIYTNYFYKLFDGIIVMTTPLHNYFATKISKKASLHLMPMTVEIDRFNKKGVIFSFEYIAYCGYMRNNKDGVGILIEAFSLIANKYPKVQLVLIGSGPESDMNFLKDMTKSFNIEKRVIFTGYVEREEMPKYLNNAKILALARPSGLQSDGGFPTKLGEYLSTGIPVLVTEVGEIPNYLTNGENAFLCTPDCPKAFSSCLDNILQNYKCALKVGNNGKRTALQYFDYKTQSESLLKYLNTFQ